ncbi:M1 family aminopeptidase [Nocardioides euryhalodurans]|uniref:Aminopeptidase N n=1 Tax=Nocardioides euryhalodurans TaxID=2518370 RepID=A0A4P7GPE5_9ACTN|nr:M1 family aminopeptidase [Nocardioides euryhalodurans]QBR94105.1 hypothetical protein EXE57_18795 [Nocardioides euryhalodurans]
MPSRLLVSQQLGPTAARASMRMLRQSPAIVEGLAEDLGRYPFSAAGGLVTGLPVYFALENQTMPTYFAVRRGRHVPLVVHEQAHQWFGDSVAIERWRDIWLNEGAATFMEHRWTETHGGPDAAQWLQDEYDARGPGSRFWQMRIADPGHDGIFATPVYLRGGMAFQALRNRIGEDDFWLLLQTWLREHEGGNAATEDFEALAAEVSGESLDGFFDAWLHTGERPARTADNGLA